VKLGWAWALGYIACWIVDICIIFSIQVFAKMLKGQRKL
jgi:hypothetical protein